MACIDCYARFIGARYCYQSHWPDVPQLEKLVTDWARTDQTGRKLRADEIQKVALSEVTYVPWGEWFQPTAFRKNVRDVLKFNAPIFWNVKVT
jgi:peptide/nickel transport system substrate-binding protein